MGGYALARFEFRGRRAFMLALLCTPGLGDGFDLDHIKSATVSTW